MILTFILNIIVIISLSTLYIVKRRQWLKKRKNKHCKKFKFKGAI